MKHFRSVLIGIFAVSLFFFSACNRLPRQVRYIPKNALAVVGVHTGKMRKELAWSAITGSGMLDSLRAEATNKNLPEALRNLENSGIDFGSTLYGFSLLDARFPDKTKLAAVLPLSDESAWEAYIKKYFPAALRHTKGSLHMMLAEGYCVGWNEEVVLVMKDMVHRLPHTEAAQTDSLSGMSMPAYSWEEEIPDTAGSLDEMAQMLQPAKNSGVEADKRFVALEKEGHDLSFWMSYDPLVDWYFSENTSGQSMLSASVAELLLKGSALTTGLDFKKGKVEGLLRYYPSDSLKDVAKEFGKENVDADMLRRLPYQGLNLAAGVHLSPALVKLLLQRLNLSGVANLALMAQGLTLDNVLGGFSGDMVLALNNFQLKSASGTDSSQSDLAIQGMPLSPKMDFVFAMKIGSKAQLEKLLGFAEKSGFLEQTTPGVYQVQAGNEVRLVVGEKYLALSSNEASAQAFLKEHAGAMPDEVHREISGHPAGLWLDLKDLKNQSLAATGMDTTQMDVWKNSIQSFGIQGGEMKDKANEYRFNFQFANKRDNSLLQLFRFAQQFHATTPVRSAPPAAAY